MKLKPRLLLAVIAVLAIVIIGCLALSKFIVGNSVGSQKTEDVLTINDLDTPGVKIDTKTSDASVDNLTKQLKSKIEEQIAAKQNPIITVQDLVSVLCRTASAGRPTQCIDYIQEFLNTKMDVLKLESEEYGQPDEHQIAYWRAQLYVDLIYNYDFIMKNKFTGPDGKPMNTSAQQLKYIDLYLKIAQDRANWGDPQVSEQDGHTWYYYEYKETDNLITLRSQLEAGRAQ